MHFNMSVARFSRALLFLPYYLTNNLDICGIARFSLSIVFANHSLAKTSM